MSRSGEGLTCARCEKPAKRIFIPPQISVPVYMATDVLNGMAAGEITAPGLTPEKTRMYANGLAALQKKNKGMKDGSLAPTISTPGSPVPTLYSKDS